MKSKIILFLAYIARVFYTSAQNPDPQFIDSLRKELARSQSDTAKIRLRFVIGDNSDDCYRIGYWDTLVRDAHRYNSTLIETLSLSNLAYMYNVSGDTVNFIKTLNKGIVMAKAYNYQTALFSFMHQLGSYYVRSQYIRKALDIGFEGLKLSEKANDKAYVIKFNELLSTCYWFLGDFNKVMESRLKALEFFKQLKDSANICHTLISLGEAQVLIKDQVSMQKYYFESAKFFKKKYGMHLSAGFYKAYGAAFQAIGQFDSAAYYFAKSYEAYKAINLKRGVVSTLSMMAENNYTWGKNAEAKRRGLEALELANAIGFKGQIPDLAFTLKKIYAKDKNYMEALKYYEMSVNTRDSISNEKNKKLAMQKEADYAFEKKENENKLLAQQNEIQTLELKQSSYIIWGVIALFTIFLFVGYLFFRQNKIKTEQQSSKLEQKLLRSQMNPHFIFNSLQAIQSFILKHNEKEAVRYLSSFASITRDVLENSRLETISLKKEIELLEKYLQLQKIRFRDKFEFEILVEPQIDIETTIVPPMLSQPFIENAIEHGFHGIENDGKITVHYFLKGNNLSMEIIDNGIGMRDNHSSGKKHRSLALEITKERIALMNKKLKEKVLFSISEGFPSERERPGVRVNFSIPLNFQI